MLLVVLTTYDLDAPNGWACMRACCCNDPLRDPLPHQSTLLDNVFLFFSIILFLFFGWFLYIYLIYKFFIRLVLVLVVGLLDLLLLPRFYIFHANHIAFLESVMAAHPELRPALVEQEFYLQLKQLTENLSAVNPGLYCRLHSSTKYFNGGANSYRTLHIQFLKFPPEQRAYNNCV